MKQNPKTKMEEMKISFYSHMDEKNESDSVVRSRPKARR
jgi:hypothetical protein